ncbi:hypothetical protein QOV31_005126 (plasmid) [Agrobacterium fabrum]|uniref:hypothetical protein n=1 Tax=Rhizobium/Agrobacterium group TaxID=227290 RepID=UPI0004DA2D51|nr:MULTISPECIES: hypothetical protein [Rhizobium/Agrobacterium group]KEA04352.1 hypothetical protein CN09_19675 [Rhizobium rhizogenes]NMV72463.1 hypothetical protein [Agrobacterium fabrum]NTI85253.1 hypothetical protein [Rhizobium rhizogenes]NTJ27286.1 hypothetical protein [Rhizobium rhizogenes]QRM41941.1 hypothetical protein F3X89_28815 [Rhizobium rhizogenes]
MHDAKQIFAYQVVPGTDEILVFTETLGLARQEASQHFEGLKAMDENVDAGIAIYKVGLKDPSPSDVVTVLNHPEDAVARLIQTIERVELIS